MGRSAGMKYNPETKKWEKVGDNSSSSQDKSGSSGSSSSGSSSSSSSKGGGGSSNLTASDSSSDSSVGATEKEYNNIEINTLEGTLNFIVTKQTIKLKAGNTVKLKGLGKYLSGKYYVKEVNRQISSDGYSHSAVLIRTDYGKKLKIKGKNTKKTKSSPATPSPSASDAQRTYTVQVGDCLWSIAKQFYGDGSAYTRIYDANTGQVVNPNLIYPGQVLVIP